MKRYFLFGFFLSFSMLFWGMTSTLSFAGEGEVKIVSPQDGEVVNSSTVVAEFQIVDKGSRGDHFHLYLDGDGLGAVFVNKFKLKNLSKGEHKLEMRLVSGNHRDLGPKHAIKFTVK